MPQVGYKMQAYPTATQRALLPQVFGHRRWIWNRFLEQVREADAAGRSRPSWGSLSTQITAWRRSEELGWLRLVPRCVLEQSLRDLKVACDRAREGVSEAPRFKSRYREQTARFQLDARCTAHREAWAAGNVYVPGLGPVRVRGYLPPRKAGPEGEADRRRGMRLPAQMPAMVTFRRTQDGRYWLSFTAERAERRLPIAPTALMGVDFGASRLAVCSTGLIIPALKAGGKLFRRIKTQQRRLARQVMGSARRARTKTRLARLHARLKAMRLDALHKVALLLLREAEVLALESLNVKGMTASAKGTVDNPGTNVAAKAGLNRAILSQCLGLLRRMLEYKCALYGRQLVLVDRWFPSSKRCSSCGHHHAGLMLRDRTWTCAACHVTHDRDVNAAVNLAAEAARLLGIDHPGERGVSACYAGGVPGSTRILPEQSSDVRNVGD